MGKRRRQVILHSPGHSDPYDRPHPTPTLRPDDPQRLACFFVLADLDYRKVALKQLHFGFRVFTLGRSDLLCVRERFCEGCSSVLG
jgi:hypothetical protein